MTKILHKILSCSYFSNIWSRNCPLNAISFSFKISIYCNFGQRLAMYPKPSWNSLHVLGQPQTNECSNSQLQKWEACNSMPRLSFFSFIHLNVCLDNCLNNDGFCPNSHLCIFIMRFVVSTVLLIVTLQNILSNFRIFYPTSQDNIQYSYLKYTQYWE
jgi:hypothetical protein